MADRPELMFPILHDPIIRAIPWAVITPHDRQAQANHGQTLKRLAQRGGLDVVEAVVILLDKPFPRDWKSSPVRLAEYRRILMQVIRDFEIGRAALSEQKGERG